MFRRTLLPPPASSTSQDRPLLQWPEPATTVDWHRPTPAEAKSMCRSGPPVVGRNHCIVSQNAALTCARSARCCASGAECTCPASLLPSLRTCCSIDRSWSISSTISCAGRWSSCWAMLLTMMCLLLSTLNGRYGSRWLIEACPWLLVGMWWYRLPDWPSPEPEALQCAIKVANSIPASAT